MTLIIATHNKNREIVFCSDSLITGKQDGVSIKLLNSFRKVKNIPVNILKPDIGLAGKITKYYEMPLEHCCMIGFAGSTLVSQHIINNIEGHLKQLRFTYKDEEYKLEMICDDNKTVMDTFWSDDMFNQSPEEILNHLTKEFQIGVIEHSIYKAIEDFIKDEDRYDKEFFDTQFIVGLSCNKSKSNHIYEIKMDFTENVPKLISKEILLGEIASIGITRYNIHLLGMFNNKSNSIEETMLQSMCDFVDNNEEVDLREIGYPIVLKTFNQFKEQRFLQKSKKNSRY